MWKPVNDAEYAIALGAVKSFSEICNRVAEAWNVWRSINLDVEAGRMATETSSDCIFTISEEPASLTDNELRLTIELPDVLTAQNYIRLSSFRLPALLNDSDTFQLPLVEIESEKYKAVLIPDLLYYQYCYYL